MKNLYLLFKNIENYGLFVFFKIIFFEIFFKLMKLDHKTSYYEEQHGDNYQLTKINKHYNTPYIPTPYYFLFIIKKFFLKKKINNFLFIDLGCGYSRTNIFFNDLFNFFLGFDYNKKIINFCKKKKYKNSHFFHINLRENNSSNFLLKKILKYKNNKKIIIFFSHSFDLKLLKKILENLQRKISFYVVYVNLKKKSFYNRKVNVLYKKYFFNKNRNIIISKIIQNDKK